MGTEYCFICLTDNIIYEVGKGAHEEGSQAKRFIPYILHRHPNTNYVFCAEDNIEREGGSNLNGFDPENPEKVYISCDNALVRYPFKMENPKYVDCYDTEFQNTLIEWEDKAIMSQKERPLKSIEARLKYSLLPSDWYNTDDKHVDQITGKTKFDMELERKMSNITSVIAKIEGLSKEDATKALMMIDVMFPCRNGGE